MPIKLSYAQKDYQFGSKINGLIDLIAGGLTVPDGLILSNDELREAFDFEKIKSSFDSEDVQEYIKQPSAFQNIFVAIEGMLEHNQGQYIVRSSTWMEDQSRYTYAGQFSSISGNTSQEEIRTSIIYCIKQMLDQKNIYHNHQEPATFSQGMSILIQQEIVSQYNGVIFTLDPQSQEDFQGLGEILAGQDLKVVQGQAIPKIFTIDWSNQQVDFNGDREFFSQSIIQKLINTCRQAMEIFPYPLDIEFVIDPRDQIYLVQARPITKLSAQVESGYWTTTNFRDGGVAAQDCPNLMWSLYEASWQTALSSYLINNGFYTQQELPALIRLKYARPYWNIGVVKEALAWMPRFKENAFNEELGVEAPSQNILKDTKKKFSYWLKLLKIGAKVFPYNHRFMRQAPKKLSWLKTQYTQLNEVLATISDDNQHSLESLWLKLINDIYPVSESTYFTQVFVNTVEIAWLKSSWGQKYSPQEIIQAMSQLTDISHRRPMKALDKLMAYLESQDKQKDRWQALTVEKLKVLMEDSPMTLDIYYFKEFLRDFGYHSSRELDLRSPTFIEDFQIPLNYIQRGQRPSLNHYYKGTSQRFSSSFKHLKKILWWREEFKDLSTRYYALIRWLALKLGNIYQQQGILKETEDIFYLHKDEIQAFIEGSMTANELGHKAANNRLYCSTYRQAQVPDYLQVETVLPVRESIKEEALVGIAANNKSVVGRVRVIHHLSQMEDIQDGEIIVTPFIDTGWTLALSRVSGIITETGGILSHVAILAREFDKALLVGVKGASQQLRTGMKVKLDGKNGQVNILGEEG